MKAMMLMIASAVLVSAVNANAGTNKDQPVNMRDPAMSDFKSSNGECPLMKAPSNTFTELPKVAKEEARPARSVRSSSGQTEQ